MSVFQQFMDEFDRQVMAEIDRLEGPEFPATRRARRQRTETIRALAAATVADEPWTGEAGVLGPRRPSSIISEKNFYEKAHWYQHPMVREVIDNVTALYLAREAAERERARQEKRAWLENKEMEAAETQFAKAGDLLALPHIAKKTKQGKDGEGPTIILDPANAAVFNAAVNLNKSASDLARRSMGLPTEVKRAELTGAEGAAISMRHDGLDEVSDEELQRRVAALAYGALAAVGEGYTDEPVASDAPGAAGDDSASEG
ncbi:MAG: hypothetical protein R3C43_19110 [Chloroflexota bacterium]